MKNGILVIFLCIVIILPASSVSAKVYKWVDENGVTQYTQLPPPDAKESATTITPKSTPTDAAEKHKQLQEKWKKEIDDNNELKEQNAEKAAEDEHNAKLKAHCETARKNLRALNDPSNRRFKTADGEISNFTDEQRKAEINKAQQYLDKHCKDIK